MIEFVGALAASKSLMNRALIVKSFSPKLRVSGVSKSRDVELMTHAVARMVDPTFENAPVAVPYECGDAGAVLRFLALRLSRIEGEHILTGSERLFSRPQKELEKVLRQLGCDVELSATQLRIKSHGWRLQGDGLFVSGSESSQFASGVMLSAWGLKTPFPISVSQKVVSEGYFAMTLKLCQRLGMRFDKAGHEIIIAANQQVTASEYTAEIDVSSAFAVAALAAVGGQARISNFPSVSLQPDRIFVSLMQEMGMAVRLDGEQLKVLRTENWQGLRADLNSSPDLLPVLAVLCAYAETASELRGLGHLAFKESDRLKKTCELLHNLGAKAEIYQNGVTTLKITPIGHDDSAAKEFTFDPDHDHRMAMAAAVAREKGAKIKILTPEVVEKSFPEFWQIAGEP